MPIVLNNWKFRECLEGNGDNSPWYPARSDTIGNQVHLDLLYNGLIPDPFIDDHEKNVQWVGRTNWEYCSVFQNSDCFRLLVIEGLDTFAKVYVNDQLVLESANLFRKYVLDIGACLNSSANILRIAFTSSLHEGRRLERIHGLSPCWNGETLRLHVRKPQYHYGWDWGPMLLTCGPWKPISLVSGTYVKDFFVRYLLNKDLTLVDLLIEVDLDLADNDKGTDLEVSIIDPNGQLVYVYEVSDIKMFNRLHYTIDMPHLWNPRGHGQQALYTFELKVNSLKLATRRAGFRKVQLVQDKDTIGRTFYFKINNKPIFVMGSNWIPAHSFTSILTCEDYRKWLQLAIDGNHNLVRVWGGGIYESDSFYSICDEQGILVWQDLMFACGMYPAYSEFVDNVKEELTDQLKRLRQYSSIVIIAGNNEDYQVAEANGFEFGIDKPYDKFPARLLYEEVFPEIVSRLTNDVPYIRSSPYSDALTKTRDTTIGDLHQWDVWHGNQEPYQNWDKLSGRFVSEFGMLSFPSLQTLDKAITKKEELYPESYLVEYHNKAGGSERRLATYVLENFALPSKFDLDHWQYITQVMQADCLSLAYRNWRRKWNNYECGGAVVWQLNDCWPATSWSIVDFHKTPKLAYYSIKRECAPIGIACRRNKVRIRDPEEPEDLSEQTPLHDFSNYKYSLDIWAFSNREQDNVSLSVLFYSSDTGELQLTITKSGIYLKNNEICNILNKHNSESLDGSTIVQAVLKNDKGEIIHRSSDWPQPIKHLNWKMYNEDLRLGYKVMQGKIKFSTNKPVKSVCISMRNMDMHVFSDNGIDLFPNDNQEVEIEGLEPDDLTIRIQHLK